MDNQKNSDPSPQSIPIAPRCPMCGGQIAPGPGRCLSCGEAPAVIPPPKSKLFGCGTIVAILGIGAVLVALLLPSVRRSREPARRTGCKINLKQIGLALHNYESKFKTLPPAYTVDAEGKPLHSWRTLILPYLDERDLYEKIDLTKPWDAPENAEALQSRPRAYYCPSTVVPKNHTTYLASVGPRACFHATESRKSSDITDGTSNTLMVIDVSPDRSIPWMSPEDADEQLILSIASNLKLAHTGGVQAVLCDGSVRFISNTVSIETRRALISIAGGDTVGEY